MNFIVHLETTEARAAEIGEMLDELSLQTTQWLANDDSGRVQFDIYFSSEHEAMTAAEELEKLPPDEPHGRLELSVFALRDEDWSEKWKEFYHTERVTPRIVIRPSWEKYTPRKDDCVIILDPGMSFGTGQHPTTRGCLSFIDLLAGRSHGASFLDLGCGSGVLAIAAAKLGLTRVTAVDIDPQAVRIAGENIRTNGLDGSIHCECAGAGDYRPASPFDIVVANILAPVLEEHAGAICGYVSCAGHARLIIAGISVDQYDRILAAYEPHGFTAIKTLVDGTWITVMFERAQAQAHQTATLDD